MAVEPGTRLGPYEIEEPLGAGGMGEVYRARDTRLDRTVAVKLLPARVSENPRLRQRFDREARALAGLSHPRICTLHDVGDEGGIRYLVMELLEGETLAARLARGPLPQDQVLETGIALADALDAAHRRGVVHRDVKPGNVMLTQGGVKLLDFGLARDLPVPEPPSSEASETRTQHAAITTEGAIVGTLGYMAPEQLEGREADARSDLYALGCVLYEMTTGAPPFQATSQAGLIASIMASNPALDRMRPVAPAALARVVQRCLAKDPEERWQSARDLLLELRWIAEGDAQEDVLPVAKTGIRWREPLAWGLSLVLLATLLTFLLRRPEPAPGTTSVQRLSVALPEGARSSFDRVSPDGRMLALSVSSRGQRSIWLRPLDSLSSRPLPGTEGGHFPFWSPDSRWIGFFADGKLKKVDPSGGPPQVLCDVPGPFSFGSWNRDGTILFNITEVPDREGIYRVADTGGTPTRLPLRDASGQELMAFWPSFLPDGRHFLSSCMSQDTLGICVAPVDTGPASTVLDLRTQRGGRVEYAEPGYLLYTRDGALVAHPFDPDRRAVSGEPVLIAGQIQASGPGLYNFSVAGEVLVYQTESVRSELIWKDRNGRTVGRVGTPGIYGEVTLGPAGQRAAVVAYAPGTDIGDVWLVELERDVATRFTTDIGDDMAVSWSRDGRRLAFSSAREAPPFMHVKNAGGGDERVLLPSRGTLQIVYDWTSDGRSLIYGDRSPESDMDLWILPLEPPGDPVPFLKTRFRELTASLSPDGNLVAYASDESGQYEVYVTTFPAGGEKSRVSTDGGYLPRWRADGKELFYLSLDKRLMAVPVSTKPGFVPGKPQVLFSVEASAKAMRPYDVTPDGNRFLVISALPGESNTPTVVTGWWTELPK